MIHYIKKYFLYIILFTIFVYGCEFRGEDVSKGVITIGSRIITEDELQKDIERVINEMGITYLEAGAVIRQIIEKVVEKNLILEYGKENEITVNDEELEAAVRNLKTDYPEDVFNELLLKRYIDIREWKKEFKRELLIKKIVSSVIADLEPTTFTESKAYFNSHQDEFMHPRMVQVRQIVTGSREEAEMLLERLSKGEKMVDLAARYSIAPEADDRGVIGWIAKGELEENMERFIFALGKGERSGILETPYGFHIFEVISIREEGISNFPDAMDEIDSILTMEKREQFYKNWINELKDHFPVNIEEKIYYKWDMEVGQE